MSLQRVLSGDAGTIAMVGFGLPLLLLLLLVVPLLAAAVGWGIWRRRIAMARFAGSGLALLRSGQSSPARRGTKIGLVLVAAALLALASARPQHGQRHLILPRSGSDVVIALDVSRSMGVQDVEPSRLDHAKQAAGALVDHLRGDRVGLVVFSGSAVSRFPLTTDLRAAHQVIDSVAILESGVKGGTDLAAALNAAGDTLKGDETHSKVVIVISDGEDLAGSDLQAAANAAKTGLTIETIGVGTAGGGPVIAVNPVSNRVTPVIDPATGQTAISHRDDGNLRQLAAAGHGVAYDGNTTDFAFDLSGAIDRLQPTQFTSGEATIPFEYFQIPLAIALVLLLADMLISENLRQRRAKAAKETRGESAESLPSPRTRTGT